MNRVDAFELAKKILDKRKYEELYFSLARIEASDQEDVYNSNKEIFDGMLFINTYDEFADFISDNVIEKSVYIFAFMSCCGSCIEIGGYEEGLQNKIFTFTKQKFKEIGLEMISLPNYEVFTDYDGVDNFMEYLINCNNDLKSFGKEFVIFQNDIYCACMYNLFMFDTNFVLCLDKEWTDSEITLVKLDRM